MARNIISSTLLLAFIPFFTYLIVFAYESAYARVLGISPNLIRLTITDIFDKIRPLVFSLVISYVVFYLSTMWKDKPGSYLLKYSILIAFVILYFFIYKSSNIHRIVFFAVIVLAIVLSEIKPIKRVVEDHLSLIDVNFKIEHIWFLLVCLIISYSYGLINVKYILRSYSVIKIDNPSNPQAKQDKVVLRIYGNNVIIADVDRNTKKVNNYSIYPLSITEKCPLILEKYIGPLQAEIK